MNNITLGQIVAIISTLSVIGAFFFAIYKWYKSNYTDRFDNIESRLDDLERKQSMQDIDIKESKEERLILIKAQLACLKGLQEQGCDGSVTQAINDIEGFLINKSHN